MQSREFAKEMASFHKSPPQPATWASFSTASRFHAAIGADHNAVGMFEIVNGCTFAQEFRVGNDGRAQVRSDLLDDALNLIARAHWNR